LLVSLANGIRHFFLSRAPEHFSSRRGVKSGVAVLATCVLAIAARFTAMQRRKADILRATEIMIG
jgi:hypothetical protein